MILVVAALTVIGTLRNVGSTDPNIILIAGSSAACLCFIALLMVLRSRRLHRVQPPMPTPLSSATTYNSDFASGATVPMQRAQTGPLRSGVTMPSPAVRVSSTQNTVQTSKTNEDMSNGYTVPSAISDVMRLVEELQMTEPNPSLAGNISNLPSYIPQPGLDVSPEDDTKPRKPKGYYYDEGNPYAGLFPPPKPGDDDFLEETKP